MDNNDLISALQALITAVSNAEEEASENDDSASAAALLSAQSSLNNALTIAGAKDIVAMLPSDADGDKLRAAISSMDQAASDISKEIKTINQTVDIASNVATFVLQLSSGNFATALGTAAHLASIA